MHVGGLRFWGAPPKSCQADAGTMEVPRITWDRTQSGKRVLWLVKRTLERWDRIPIEERRETLKHWVGEWGCLRNNV